MIQKGHKQKEKYRKVYIYIGEGNGNLFQYSCLENPMDRGACWATVHGGHKESDTTESLTYTHTFVYISMSTWPIPDKLSRDK